MFPSVLWKREKEGCSLIRIANDPHVAPVCVGSHFYC